MNSIFKPRNILMVAALVLLAGLGLFVSKAAKTTEADRAASASSSSSANSNAKGLIARPALTVSLSGVQSASWNSTLAANGSVAAWQEAIIGTELNGVRLVELFVQVGEQVRRGQLLARFSSDILATEVAQQRAALADAEASLAEAQSNARRALQLKESGAISAQQISQYATARNIAAAKVSAARAGLQAANIRLQQARVLAPDDGVISSRSATLGAVAQSGQELFRFIRQGKLEWRAELTAEDSSRISIGQGVTVFTAEDQAIPGKVRMLAPTVDPQTRKALVYVDLLLAPKENLQIIKAGMFARGEFSLGETTALSVPASALVLRDGHASVFVVDSKNKVKQVRVNTGRTRQERVEILTGLANDARVVESGAGFLADGDTVRVATADAGSSKSTPLSPTTAAATGK